LALARVNAEAGSALQTRLRRQALLIGQSHRSWSRRAVLLPLLEELEHVPHQHVNDCREDHQADDELQDRPDVDIALLVLHIRVLDVRNIRRLVYVIAPTMPCHNQAPSLSVPPKVSGGS